MTMKLSILFCFFSLNIYAAFVTSNPEGITNIIVKSDAKLFSPSEASSDCAAAVASLKERLIKLNEIILDREDESRCLVQSAGNHKYQAIISILKR